MLGAILGDIAGSTYEFKGLKIRPRDLWTKQDFLTDDTVLTCATAAALLGYSDTTTDKELQTRYLAFIRRLVDEYPYCSWGSKFLLWVLSLPSEGESIDGVKFNDSFGNGCAMKIAPVAYVAKSLDEVKRLSRVLTEVTHNTEKGIYYAEAVAVAVYTALHTNDKEEVRKKILEYCPEVADIDSYAELQARYRYTELAQDTVPQALYCFLISDSFDDAISNAIGLGGDADTLAAITGSVAEAFYKYDDNNSYDKTMLKVFRNYFEPLDKDDFEQGPLEKIVEAFSRAYRLNSVLKR